MWNIFDAVRAMVLVGFISMFLLLGCSRNNPEVTNDGASMATPVDGQSSEDLNVQNGGDATMGSINSGTTNQRSPTAQSTTGDTTRGQNTISGGNFTGTTTATTSNSNTGTSTELRTTQTTDVIRRAQAQLNNKGYAVSVNGVLEAKTMDAIRNFQRDNNLQSTGQLDKATLNALQVQVPSEDTRAPASVQEPIN